jgi:preprotein translocase subunit YajC
MDTLIKKGTNVDFTLSGNTGTVTAIANSTIAITNDKGEKFNLPHSEVNRMIDSGALKPKKN